VVKYSYFEKEGGSHASSSLQKRIAYSDMHSLEIKKAGKDTLPDENMELLRVGLSLSHNLAADSMKFSDLSATFRTPFLKALDFNGRANFTLYDEIKNERNAYQRVNQYLINNSKGLARLTSLSFSLSTSYSSDGFQSPSNQIEQHLDSILTGEEILVEDVDTTSRLGRRFNKRLVTEEILQHQNL
jgi:hypothetical protein